MTVELHFDRGTLVVPAMPESAEVAKKWLTEDPRTETYRALAQNYRNVVLELQRAKVPFKDHARRFSPVEFALQNPHEPRPYQAEALKSWMAAGRFGIVQLPTGAGKTYLAMLAIEKVGRPTLVVVPTIELLVQWQRNLAAAFGVEVGMYGGGSKDVKDLTVITYDSAKDQIEFLGDRFGLLVCDECHHLPAPAYQFIAQGALAPFRLGLTATLERNDGGEEVAKALLGPVVHTSDIRELEGDYLAPYEVRRIEVELDEDEQSEYDANRTQYLEFFRSTGVRLDHPSDWQKFIVRAHQSKEGRAAYAAYRIQRKIAFFPRGKITALWQILRRHRNDRILVFTNDNESVYDVSERFLFPTITHKTKATERKALLAAFSKGELPVLVAAKVLNEGVDVPEANVAVIMSGSGDVKEHVQRLGRILRKRPGKEAILYEIISGVEAEAGVSERRRQHRAYLKDS